jgi:hypothetical protein
VCLLSMSGELWPSEEVMMGQYCSSFSKPRNGRRQGRVLLLLSAATERELQVQHSS